MKGVKLDDAETAMIRDLHSQGFNDFDIAAELERSERSVYNYRRAMDLPALPQNCREQVSKLHDKGLPDKEIAERLSRSKPITALQVSAIRRSLGKKVIKRGLSGAQRRKRDLQSTAYEKYTCRQLKSDAEIAKLYGDLSYAA